jgi:Collagen triple helix repeat (20 copies)
MKNMTRFAIAALTLAPIAGFAQTLAPTQDAYFVPGNGSNFGTATTVTVGSSGSVGLIQFDLTQLPAGLTAAQIQKATLTLFLDHVNAGGSINIDTVSAATPWGELTVTGNSGISPGLAVNTSVMTNTADTFIALDATSAVQGWITTPSSNNGFMIQANTGASVQFDSKENTSTSHPATLTLVLVSVGPSGATGSSGTNGINGATGVTGPTGPSGPMGVAGPTGASGSNGATGAAGPTGVAGPAGVTGSNGATGSNGSNGATGPTGVAGPSGANGTNGANGATGPAGPAGSAGTNGSVGANGATGATGPAGALSTTFFEFNSLFNDSNDAGSDLYFSPASTVTNNGSTSPSFSTNNQMVVPLACTMSGLSVGAYVQTLFTNSPGTATITLFRGTGTATPTATPITCTTGTIANSAGSVASCSDTTHTVVLAAGDIVTLKLHEPTNSTANDVVDFGVHLRCQ